MGIIEGLKDLIIGIEKGLGIKIEINNYFFLILLIIILALTIWFFYKKNNEIEIIPA